MYVSAYVRNGSLEGTEVDDVVGAFQGEPLLMQGEHNTFGFFYI